MNPLQRLLLRFFLCVVMILALVTPAPDIEAGHRKNWGELSRYLSEPGGYFDSDNFISNESSYLTVIPRVRSLGIKGGVYIGVGPDQNFTYLTQVRPEQAFIIDIRRQNMLQHVLYKALFEQSRSRLEFLSLLFSRPVKLPSDKGKSYSIQQLIAAVEEVQADPELFRRNVERVKSRLSKYHLDLNDQDHELLHYIYRNFQEQGLDIRYKSFGREFQWRYPTFRDLIVQQDLEGAHSNYLASEESFQWLRKFQEEDRLVPVVGDLSGKLAMKKIAKYLNDNRKVMSTFYVSNVEFYLMRNGVFENYVENVRDLPINERSIFIRSYFGYGLPHPEQVDPHWMSSVMQSVRSFLMQHDRVPYTAYRDLATRDYISIKQPD